MAISTTLNRIAYAGNGVTLAFAFPYPFLAQGDLVVVVRNNTTGAEVTKTLTTHYTVSGGSGAAGTVTMLTAPATGETLTVYDDPAITQGLDLRENDPLPAESAETAYDRLTLICQRLKDRVDRAIRLSEGYSATFNPILPGLIDPGSPLFVTNDGAGIGMFPGSTSRASQFLGFDASGYPIAGLPLGTLSTIVSAYIQTLLDDPDSKTARATLGLPSISVKDYGAKGDGATDDTVQIQNAFNALPSGGEIFFPPGTYIVSDTITVPNDKINVRGFGTSTIVKAKNAADYDAVFQITGRTGVVFRDFLIDANKANRTGIANRTQGLGFTSCTDCLAMNMTVQNTRGNGSVPAIGIGLGGAGLRNIISHCRLLNCGDVGFASDGVYMSGDYSHINACIAINCQDTGFVLEKCNYSEISGCRATGCSAAAAITAQDNVGVAAYKGNKIVGLVGENFVGLNTGGIQIGCLTGAAATTNLEDTQIIGVILRSTTATGPGINFRRTGNGQVKKTLMTGCEIYMESGNQAVLIDRTDQLKIQNCIFVGFAGSWTVQIQDYNTKLTIQNCDVTGALNTNCISGGGANCNEFVITNNRIISASSSYGIYLSGNTGTFTSIKTNNNVFSGSFGQANIGGDATTAPRDKNDIIAGTAAPTSALEGKWEVGTLIKNTTSVVGQTAFWTCTTAGVAGSGAVFTPTGIIGSEVLEQASAVAAGAPGASTVFANFNAGLTLTEGTWDLDGGVTWVHNGATLTGGCRAALSTSASGSGTIGSSLTDEPPPTANYNVTCKVTAPRVTVAAGGTQTWYITGAINYTAGTPQGTYRITARRVLRV
jgi:hypothetical protein